MVSLLQDSFVNNMCKVDIKSFNLDELTEYLVEKGYPKFRAKQLY